jgi:hypothetical protein
MTDGVEKRYLDLASGEMGEDEKGLLVSQVPAKGRRKEVPTEYTVLGRGGGFTFLELNLKSGRTHQIRRKLADPGFPLAGDSRYSGPMIPVLDRLFLHGFRLAFLDSFGGPDVVMESPCHLNWKNFSAGSASEGFDFSRVRTSTRRRFGMRPGVSEWHHKYRSILVHIAHGQSIMAATLQVSQVSKM